MAVVLGGSGDDSLNGTNSADTITGAGGNDTIDGLNGSDMLDGGAGDDIILAGLGSDFITGGAGNDIILVNLRDFGQDTVTDFVVGSDRINLSALNIADFVTLQPFMRQVGLDTVIEFGYSNRAETLTLKNVALNTLGAGAFIFDTGTVGEAVSGTSLSDALFGGLGNDTMDGGNGSDTLTGGAGDDIILAGLGSDFITGGAGNDIILVNLRDFGQETVTDFAVGSDRINLSALNIADFATLQPFMRQVGLDTVVEFGYSNRAETLTLKNVALNTLDAGAFIFDTGTAGETVSGTSLSDALFGGLGNDTIEGGNGSDTLTGGAGDDTILAGLGNDLISGGTGDDVVLFSGASSRYTMSFDFAQSVLVLTDTLSGGNGTDRIRTDVETLRFTDIHVALATVAPRFSVSALQGSVSEGNAGSTPVTFTVTRDGPTGGASTVAWQIEGTGVNPANAADFAGGVLPFGSVTFAVGEVSRAVTVNIAGDTAVELNEAFLLRLLPPAGGVLGTATAAVAIANDDVGGGPVPLTAGNDTFQGTAGADNVAGLNGNDVLNGLGGNDSLDGGNGNDTLDGGTGRDTLFGGRGNDLLLGGHGTDTLNGGAGADTLIGGAGADLLVTTNDGARDVFRLLHLIEGGDALRGFVSGQDVIEFSRSGLGFIPGTAIGPDTFVSGAAPVPGTDAPTLVFNTTTGVLALDLNGSEVNDSASLFVLFRLGAGTSLVASDLAFI